MVNSCSALLQQFCGRCFMFMVSCKPLTGPGRAFLHIAEELYDSEVAVCFCISNDQVSKYTKQEIPILLEGGYFMCLDKGAHQLIYNVNHLLTLKQGLTM